MKPSLVFVDDLEKEHQAKMKGKLFLGSRSFMLTKKHYGILYGAEFEAVGVKFILDTRLGENQVYSDDPNLVELLRAVEAQR